MRMARASCFVILSEVEGSPYLCRSSKPVCRQIFLARVIALNQGIFLRPSPALQLFLPRNGVANITEMRTVNQAGAMIILSESMDLAAAMLSDTHEQIVGHADVERGTRLVAHHVNPIVVIARQN